MYTIQLKRGQHPAAVARDDFNTFRRRLEAFHFIHGANTMNARIENLITAALNALDLAHDAPDLSAARGYLNQALVACRALRNSGADLSLVANAMRETQQTLAAKGWC